MSEIKLTQLYDKDGNVLFPNIRLKTINNTSLIAEYEMGDERNNLIINGKDGSDFLFAYCLTKDYSMPTQLDRGDNFVSSESKGEWSDNPKGVDVIWKYEWVSISVKRAGADYYSKFTSPILWAKWGDNGISSRTVFAYRSMNNPNDVPLVPEGGSVDFENNSIVYPKDASGNQWGPNENLDGIVWLSQKDFHSDGKQDALWTPPIRITGNEGVGIEFIYQLCKSESDVTNVSLPSSDASIGYPNDTSKDSSIWTKCAQGIDEIYKIEVCSQRTKSEKDGWSEWSKPFIWSKWGEDGIDGDGVEYIYKIGSITNGSYDEVDYPVASENYETYKDIIQEDDFCPNETWLEKYANEHEGVDYENIKSLDTNWYDSPKDVGPSEPVEYVSIRKKKDGVWGEFSKPTIWNVWKRDGYDTYTEFLFTSIPSNDTLKDCTVSGGNYKNPKQNLTTTNSESEVKDVSWSDTLPDYVDGNSIWMISSFFTSNVDHESYYANWSSPSKMTDSQTLQVEYSNTENIDASNINQLQDIWENNSSLGVSELETKFIELESSRGVVWGNENIVSPIWMATSRLMDGKWSKWVVSKIKGEKGVSSLYVSMSNDVDQVYVTNGVVKYKQKIKTTLNVWDGIEDVTKDSLVSSTYEDASIIYNEINKSYDLSVIFDVSKSITDDSISIPIEIDYGGRKIEKVFKVLVLNGNIDYDLVVSPLVIKRDGNGDLIDSSAKIEVNIKKAEIGNYTWQNGFCEIIPNGYKINFTTGDGRMYTFSQDTSLPLTISNDLKGSYKNVKTFTFSLFKEENDEYKLVDKEIVEVVSNGETLKIKEKKIQYGTSSSYETEPTSWVDTIPNVSQGHYLWVKTTIIYEDDSDYSYTTYTRQGKDGSKGSDGKQGTRIYPAGKYDKDTTYDISRNCAPYVEHNGEYYVLDIGPVTNQDPATSIYWDKMDKFKAIYTEMMIADGGTLGGAVFDGNGAYMFSKMGTLDGSYVLSYQNFDSSNVVKNIFNYELVDSNKYIPNYLIDFNEGNGWFGGGNVIISKDGTLTVNELKEAYNEYNFNVRNMYPTDSKIASITHSSAYITFNSATKAEEIKVILTAKGLSNGGSTFNIKNATMYKGNWIIYNDTNYKITVKIQGENSIDINSKETKNINFLYKYDTTASEIKIIII